jgi:hypothetical protein
MAGFAIAISTQLGSSGLGGAGVPPASTYQHLLLTMMWLV